MLPTCCPFDVSIPFSRDRGALLPAHFLSFSSLIPFCALQSSKCHAHNEVALHSDPFRFSLSIDRSVFLSFSFLSLCNSSKILIFPNLLFFRALGMLSRFARQLALPVFNGVLHVSYQSTDDSLMNCIIFSRPVQPALSPIPSRSPRRSMIPERKLFSVVERNVSTLNMLA